MRRSWRAEWSCWSLSTLHTERYIIDIMCCTLPHETSVTLKQCWVIFPQKVLSEIQRMIMATAEKKKTSVCNYISKCSACFWHFYTAWIQTATHMEEITRSIKNVCRVEVKTDTQDGWSVVDSCLPRNDKHINLETFDSCRWGVNSSASLFRVF